MSSTNYFSYFPTLQYNNTIAVDILKRARLKDIDTLLKSAVFYQYTIADGERPEDIAQRYYGNTKYYWLILYANNIVNLYAQWPRSIRVFENFINSKYSSIEKATQTIHHYEDTNGNYIMKKDWNGSPVTEKSLYDYEWELNEKKRFINIIKKDYLNQIIKEMSKIFNK